MPLPVEIDFEIISWVYVQLLIANFEFLSVLHGLFDDNMLSCMVSSAI